MKRPKAGGIQITASGRFDWVGTLELKPEQIRKRPILNTARVIAESSPDVLAVVESDNRPSLRMFNKDILPQVGSHRFEHVMLVDGNDERGIDVGLMTTAGFSIGQMRSHVDDLDSKGAAVFSRDCPEYEITTAKGNPLLLMINHLKSKGYGTPKSSDARRKAQAQRVADIYNGRRGAGVLHIAIVGDFNDTPTSDPLQPLLQGTDLRDISEHPTFQDGGRPGTYGSCTQANEIDYLLLSPELFELVQSGGIERRGMWPGVRPPKWVKFDEVLREADVASDHALVWADIDF